MEKFRYGSKEVDGVDLRQLEHHRTFMMTTAVEQISIINEANLVHGESHEKSQGFYSTISKFFLPTCSFEDPSLGKIIETTTYLPYRQEMAGSTNQSDTRMQISSRNPQLELVFLPFPSTLAHQNAAPTPPPSPVNASKLPSANSLLSPSLLTSCSPLSHSLITCLFPACFSSIASNSFRFCSSSSCSLFSAWGSTPVLLSLPPGTGRDRSAV